MMQRTYRVVSFEITAPYTLHEDRDLYGPPVVESARCSDAGRGPAWTAPRTSTVVVSNQCPAATSAATVNQSSVMPALSPWW